jgi:tetratricopeptide (TPR) repeat protein
MSLHTPRTSHPINISISRVLCLIASMQTAQLSSNALFEAGNTCFRNRQYDQAVTLYKEALKELPHSADIHFNLGVTLLEKKEPMHATEHLQKAIELDPYHTKAHLQLAKVYHAEKKKEQALDLLQKAAAINPDLLDVQYELASFFSDEQQYARALEHADILVAKQPENIHYSFQRANILNMMHRTQDALDGYKKILEKHPDNVSVLYNIAYTLKKLGRIADAMPYYHKTLERNPEHIEAHFSLGLAYLITGDFKRGWQKYEWRWKRSAQEGTERRYTQPLWDGSPLNGKKIYLYAEQGLGDTYQFIRYAQEAKKRGGYVIVAVQRPLLDIIKNCPYIDRVMSLQERCTDFDVYAPLMSLPYILNTTIDTIPLDIPYLHATPELEQKWAERLSHDTKFKVGICWQGNDKYSTPFLRSVVAAKSAPLNLFAQLGSVEGVSVYNLQRETGTDQLNSIHNNFKLITFEGDFDSSNGRFMDTAAVMRNLDLIITIDTSIGHIAAGLGMPTWVLIPEPPDWRWMLDRADTPWYPNMRLFRQPTPGDWETVMGTIVCELGKLVNKKKENMRAQTKTESTSLPVNSLAKNTGALAKPHQSALENEHALLAKKLADTALVIQGLSASKSGNKNELDEQFAKQVERFYLLNSMRKVIAQKLELL